MRIAVVQRAQGTGELSVLLTIELFKERDQRGSVFHRELGAPEHLLHHSFVSFSTSGCADG